MHKRLPARLKVTHSFGELLTAIQLSVAPNLSKTLTLDGTKLCSAVIGERRSKAAIGFNIKEVEGSDDDDDFTIKSTWGCI